MQYQMSEVDDMSEEEIEEGFKAILARWRVDGV